MLIPKVSVPKNLNQFRHNILCNVLYKILTKVLTNRMKVVLPYIIGHGQTSFMLGRSTVDNIIIAQEMAHSMLSKKS